MTELPVGTFTLYNNFDNCPHKAYRIYVKKDLPRQEQTPEMAFGNHVHTAMELRLGRGAELPDDLKKLEPIAAQLDALPPDLPRRTEFKLAFKADGTPCDWYASGEWFRIKMDWHVRSPSDVWLIDWKTGKPREEPWELECASLALKIHFPAITSVVAQYYWTQENKLGLRYTLNNWPSYFAQLQRVRNEMEQYAREGDWPKRKNPLCGWCPVTDCEHWKPRKQK